MLGLKPSLVMRTFCCLKVSVVARDSCEGMRRVGERELKNKVCHPGGVGWGNDPRFWGGKGSRRREEGYSEQWGLGSRGEGWAQGVLTCSRRNRGRA